MNEKSSGRSRGNLLAVRSAPIAGKAPRALERWGMNENTTERQLSLQIAEGLAELIRLLNEIAKAKGEKNHL